MKDTGAGQHWRRLCFVARPSRARSIGMLYGVEQFLGFFVLDSALAAKRSCQTLSLYSMLKLAQSSVNRARNEIEREILGAALSRLDNGCRIVTFTFYAPRRARPGESMSQSIRVIEQGGRPGDRALCVSRRIAGEYIASGKLVWVVGCEGRIARKTARWDRLEKDERVSAGRPGAQRGLSARVGAHLAKAWRRRESWAVAMLSQIMQGKRVG